MSEQAKLPPSYNAIFEELMGPDELEEPSTADLVTDARETAWQMATAFSARLDELGALPYDQMFHDVPLIDGSIRVAVSPPGNLYESTGGPVWRVTINEAHNVYKDGSPREQWDIMDILVKPGDLRLAEKHSRLLYMVGYGEMGPPPGIPPRIIRDLDSYRYTLSNAQGYSIKLPEIPLGMGAERLRHYQKFSTTIGTTLDVFSKLSDVTKVETLPNLDQNGEL